MDGAALGVDESNPVRLIDAFVDALNVAELERVWIGTSGWTYDSWRGPFFPKYIPKRRWLSWYATQFTTEINRSRPQCGQPGPSGQFVERIVPSHVFAENEVPIGLPIRRGVDRSGPVQRG